LNLKCEASSVFVEDNPGEAEFRKLSALHLFLNVNEDKNNMNAQKNFKKKLHFMTSTVITNLVIKKVSLLGN
jgi:hypothetical protein